jgi:peptidyl-tRNA hydrolase
MEPVMPTQRLSVGMSKAEVEKLWGLPSAAKRRQTRSGTTEEWIYEWQKSRQAKLIFQNEVLETIED